MLERIFLQVLRLSITAVPLILAVMAMRLLLRRAPRWIHCALWGLVAMRLVCPFTITSALSLLPTQERMEQTVSDLTRSHYDVRDRGGGTWLDDRMIDLALIGNKDVLASQAPMEKAGEPVAAASGTGSAHQAASAASGGSSAENDAPVLPSLVPVLSIIWLAGMGAIALYGLGSWLHLRKKVATAVYWYADLWQCETVDTPFVLGLFRPRVYLPFQLDKDSAAHIIAHEHAHIRRHDQWTKLFAYALLSIYWFNPLYWLVYKWLGRDIELACDERVIQDLNLSARQKYASALLEWGTDKPALPACPLAFGEVGVGERIIKVMKYKKPARWAAALAAVLAVAAAVCFLTDPAAEASTDDAQAVTEPPAPIEEAATPEPTSEPTAEPTPARYTETLTGADGNAVYAIDAPVPEEAPGPASVLTVKPRGFTVEEVQKVVKAIFGDAEIYEYAEGSEYNQQAVSALLALEGGDEAHTPEALAEKYIAGGMDPDRAEQVAAAESELYTSTVSGLRENLPTLPETADLGPCEWTFYPEAHYDSNYAGAEDTGHQLLEANAWMNGLSYHINVCNKPVTDNAYYRANIFSIWPDHDGYGLIPYEPFSDGDADATLDTVRRYLADAGLDKYQIAEVYETGYSGGLTVVCLPAYGNIRQAYKQDYAAAYNEDTGRTTYGEFMEFAFCAPGRLYSFHWYTPQEMTAVSDPLTMLTFSQAMDVFRSEAAKVPATVGVPTADENGNVVQEEYPRDTLHVDDIVFGYTRMIMEGINEEYALIPCWALLGRNSDSIFHGPLLVISAVNGTVIRTVDDHDEVRANVSLAIEPLAGDTAAPLTQVTPTPRPQIIDLEVWGDDRSTDYAQSGHCSLSAGATIDLRAVWYPQIVTAVPEWTIDDPSIVAIQPDGTGIGCRCEMVGEPGTETTLHVKVNEMVADIQIFVM